jgi:hypothetical protein
LTVEDKSQKPFLRRLYAITIFARIKKEEIIAGRVKRGVGASPHLRRKYGGMAEVPQMKRYIRSGFTDAV